MLNSEYLRQHWWNDICETLWEVVKKCLVWSKFHLNFIIIALYDFYTFYNNSSIALNSFQNVELIMLNSSLFFHWGFKRNVLWISTWSLIPVWFLIRSLAEVPKAQRAFMQIQIQTATSSHESIWQHGLGYGLEKKRRLLFNEQRVVLSGWECSNVFQHNIRISRTGL